MWFSRADVHFKHAKEQNANCSRHRDKDGKEIAVDKQDKDVRCTCAEEGSASFSREDCVDVATHAGLTGGIKNDVVAEVRFRYRAWTRKKLEHRKSDEGEGGRKGGGEDHGEVGGEVGGGGGEGKAE